MIYLKNKQINNFKKEQVASCIAQYQEWGHLNCIVLDQVSADYGLWTNFFDIL